MKWAEMDLGAMPDVAGARVIVVRDATEAIVGCAAQPGPGSAAAQCACELD